MAREAIVESVSSSQYLTFQSAGDAYAVDILQVKEIIPYAGSTKVPLAPETIRGLINLRGSAVAVVDLAVRFGAPRTEVSKRTCVVILDVATEDGETVMGILADSVSEVIDVPDSEIDRAPSFGVGVESECVEALAKVGDEFVPILNVQRVLAPNEALAALLPAIEGHAPPASGSDDDSTEELPADQTRAPEESDGTGS